MRLGASSKSKARKGGKRDILRGESKRKKQKAESAAVAANEALVEGTATQKKEPKHKKVKQER